MDNNGALITGVSNDKMVLYCGRLLGSYPKRRTNDIDENVY